MYVVLSKLLLQHLARFIVSTPKAHIDCWNVQNWNSQKEYLEYYIWNSVFQFTVPSTLPIHSLSCCTCSSVFHVQLSCLAFQSKPVKTSQNLIDSKITPKSIELHNHMLRKHLISHLRVQTQYLLLFIRHNKTQFNSLQVYIKIQWMAGRRSNFCLIQQTKFISSWTLRKSIEFCDYRLQGSLQ